MLEDKTIIALYWDRNETAISATSEKYGRYCTSIANNILGDAEDAEECVNDTYLQAWNAMPPQKPKVLSAFLGKITRNLSLNRYKQKNAEKRGGGAVHAVLDELAELVSDTEDAADQLYEKELITALDAFLSTLPPQKRSIFVCRYWYSDRVSDIAQQHGIREGTVSMMLGRLRRQLHTYLTERGFDI